MGIDRREKHSWRQGSQIDAASLLNAGLIHPDQQDRPMVVITHDCDIQSDKVEHIEIIWGSFATISGDLSFGKNPRTLQLINAFNDGQTLQLDQSQKILIRRSWLLSNSNEPIAKLSDENGRLLASWLASRYKRAPFPDSFVDRLRHAKTIDRKELNNALAKADRNLSKQLEAHFSLAGAPIEGLYVGLSGNEKNELDATNAYSLKLAVVARSGPAS